MLRGIEPIEGGFLLTILDFDPRNFEKRERRLEVKCSRFACAVFPVIDPETDGLMTIMGIPCIGGDIALKEEKFSGDCHETQGPFLVGGGHLADMESILEDVKKMEAQN